ncbi:hypothetical protein [Xenorhabdus kozodoii]|uniref:Uncharacterized protein n=1 Tax=Xenorhabdus kozodoii TaxID=351676 RepID=A0A2D0L0V1_9GAMM|nr:hypothetical protein [Xenorhabdus kozodoii]PHM69298.1 hypothetical protein Xkoz_03475 [Xenorhabdus kozodoii]
MRNNNIYTRNTATYFITSERNQGRRWVFITPELFFLPTGVPLTGYPRLGLLFNQNGLTDLRCLFSRTNAFYLYTDHNWLNFNMNRAEFLNNMELRAATESARQFWWEGA